jgi:hypothetical protein
MEIDLYIFGIGAFSRVNTEWNWELRASVFDLSETHNLSLNFNGGMPELSDLLVRIYDQNFFGLISKLAPITSFR